MKAISGKAVLLALVALLAADGPALAADPDDPFEKCERRFAESPQAEFACGCFYSLGARQVEHAERVLLRLAELRAADPGNPCLSFTLGRLEVLLRRPQGERNLVQAADAYAGKDMAEGETYARLNLVDLASERGNDSEAEAQLDRAAAVAERAGRLPGKSYLPVEVKVRRAMLWLRSGVNLERVESLLLEAESALPEVHESLQRDTLQVLGRVQHRLGRRDSAEATFQRMIEVTRRTNWSGQSDRYGEAAARHNLALAYLARPPSAANVEAAIARFEEALAAARKSGHPVVEADALRLLGRLRGGAEGRRQIERSVALARELEDPYLLRLGLAALAAELAPAEPARASALVAAAERVELAPESRDLPIYGWFDRLAASWQLRGRGAATARARTELAAIEAQRERQQDSLARAETFSVWADAYSWLAGHLLEAGEPEEAFDLLERRHARVLLEIAGTSSGRAPAVQVEDDGSGGGFARLAEVRAALAADQAMLYFQQAYERDTFGDFAGGSWLLAITRDQTRLYRIDDPLRLDPLLPGFSALLVSGAGDSEATAKAAARLAGGLFGKALAELPGGVRRLVVVPDEDLQLLPFGALRASAASPRLAELYEIAVLPSATLWLRWLRPSGEPSHPPAAVLALADPQMPPLDEPLDPLPGARREGRQVRRAIGGDSELWLGEEAGEAPLRAADLSRYGLLHFAAHAVHGLPGARSERSALVLAAGGGEDGLLRPGEIRGLALGGQAVILSACRGADGEVLAGEGPLSLASAFFAAGAEVVVAGLWNLGDQAAARFHQDFYRHLARGESAGQAFAAAQRARIDAGDPPAAWAGLVLLGNGDWRLEPLPSRRPWWIAGAVLALALVWLAQAKMRARRVRTPSRQG